MGNSSCSLLILGTSTFSLEIADLASDIDGIEVAGFVENMEPRSVPAELEGLPIYWVDEIAELVESHKAVCSLGTTFRGRFTNQVADLGMNFITLLHPSARISSITSIGYGTIVSAGSIIASYTQLGKHVIVNRGVLIGHHTKIGDYTTILPGANIAGTCQIGEAAFIGMGSIILNNLSIGSHSVIGAGAFVTKDVPDNVMVIGSPAQVLKRNIPGW